MNVTISSLTFDPVGFVIIPALASSEFGETKRRMSRVATLDGNAAFNDFGFSESDKTMVVEWAYDPTIDDAIEYMAQTYAAVNVATNGGLWQAAIETYTKSQISKLTIMPIAKIAG